APDVYLAQLWTMLPDGSGLRRIPHTRGAAQPAWSPDGRWIAFTNHGALEEIQPDGTNLRRLAADAADPAWSPDGRRIAYQTTLAAGTIGVAVLDLGAKTVQTLPANVVGPVAWSPDGRWLAC